MKTEIPEIIVIDDSPNAAKEFAELIEYQTGFRVKPFIKSTDLLEYIEYTNVKVAVIDQVMPDIRGTELFEQIKQKAPNVLGLMLTGEATKEEVAKAINGGFSSYLSKNEIVKLPDKVLELYVKYNKIAESKEIKATKALRIFPFYRKVFSPCFLVSCIQYGSTIVSDDSETILDIYAGEEKEWSSVVIVENKIQIDEGLEKKLESELSLSARQIRRVATKINSNILSHFSKSYTFGVKQTDIKKTKYMLPAPSSLNEVHVSRRVIEQYPLFQRYCVILRQDCYFCKQSTYIPVIISKQTTKLKTYQTDYFSDSTPPKKIDLGIHNAAKSITPRN